jgi:hypothetical protein
LIENPYVIGDDRNRIAGDRQDADFLVDAIPKGDTCEIGKKVA